MASQCPRISFATRFSNHIIAHVCKCIYLIIQIVWSLDLSKLKRGLLRIIWYFTPATKRLSLAATELIISSCYIVSALPNLRNRRIKGSGCGGGRESGEGSACYKSRFFCISAYCFTVIGLTELSVQWPIRIRRAFFCMTAFTREGVKKYS